MRVVILGGSGAATPELADGLADWPGGAGRRPALDLVLVSRSRDKLDLVVRETASRAAGLPGEVIRVSGETERRAALDGAEIVVNAVRIGGLAARTFDETFPQAIGIPGEETMGPGGFANAVRTIPALAETWTDIALFAPDALVINLTNPAGIVVAAAERQSGLRIVSMCDSPATLCEALGQRLDLPAADVRRRYLGMNHVGWWVPGSPAQLEATLDLAVGQDPGAVAASEAIGGPYLRYYLHPDRVLETQRGADEVRAQQLKRLESTLLAGFATGAGGLPRRGAAWYSKAVVPLLDAWTNGSSSPLIVGMRNDRRVPTLSPDVMTEGPVEFPAPGKMRSVPAPALPELPAAQLSAHATFEALTVDAVMAGSPRPALLRAMFANPMVGTWDQAVGLVDQMLASTSP